MVEIGRRSYWFKRMLASDPGHKRLQQAGKATLSVISAVFTTLFILELLGHEPLLPSIISGVCGLLGIMAVMDETKAEKKVTTTLLPLTAIIGVTCGSLLSFSAVLVSALMITAIFCSFYFSKFGTRYFSLGMIGFITVYFSSFLKLPPVQFPWFYGAICIGIGYAYLYNFIIFRDNAQQLKRSVQSFHRQANLTLEMLAEVIQDPLLNTGRSKQLRANSKKLRDYANHVSTDLNAQNIREIWPKVRTDQMRLYVFDTAMFVMTLSESLEKLKEKGAFESDELRFLLLQLLRTLQKADVLKVQQTEDHLAEAERVVGALRKMIDREFGDHETKPQGWMYLLRRIEAMATHVTEGALSIKYSTGHLDEEREEAENDSEPEEAESNDMEPTTKKAIQSLIAGTAAVFAGHLFSPIQPYWVLLTVFIVLLGTPTVGRTYLKGVERSIGTVAGAVIGFFLAKAVSGQSEVEVTLIFVVIFLAFYILPVSYTIMSLFITMLIAFMYDLILGGISYPLLLARVIDTIVGAAIAFTAAAFIYPTPTLGKVKEQAVDYLEHLQGYVLLYLQNIRRSESMKGLADKAFELDGMIQGMEEETKPALQRPGANRYSGIPRLLMSFTAINFYAKQLVASTYQKDFKPSSEIISSLDRVEKIVHHNIRVLMDSLTEEHYAAPLHSLKNEREIIERHAPAHHSEEGDLIHHLYYVWKINQALLLIGERMGLESSETWEE